MSQEFKVNLEGIFDAQGGGHGGIVHCKVDPGKVDCIAKVVNHKEGTAYPLLALTPLKDHIPMYYGNHDINGEKYLVIEDLTSGFNSPCVGDFKVGTRHYDLDAKPEKIKYLTDKEENSTTRSHGVRVIDACTRKNGEKMFHCGKKDGLKLTRDGLKDTVAKFLPTKHLRSLFIEKLEKFIDALEETVKENPGFRVYASSILVVYDGDADLDCAELRLKLIDFAHLYIDIRECTDKVDDSLNDGVIYGCKSLLSIAKEL